MAARAFQIQVQNTGTIDGVTPLVVPDPLPAPRADGVVVIDVGPNVNVGIIDFLQLLNTRSAIWVRAIQAEFSGTTRAAEVFYETPGSRQAARPVRTLESAGPTPPVMELITLSEQAVLPIGSFLRLDTDDTNASFGGLAAAGPHSIYFEIDPADDDDQIAAALKMQGDAYTRKSDGQQSESLFTPVAASGVDDLLIVQAQQNPDLDAISQVLRLDRATVSIGTAPAAGETLQIDIIRVADGTGATTVVATITVNNTFAANTSVDFSVIARENRFGIGDRLQILRTYVAGGAPAPVDNILVTVKLNPFTNRGVLM